MNTTSHSARSSPPDAHRRTASLFNFVEDPPTERTGNRLYFRSAYALTSKPYHVEWLIKGIVDKGSLAVLFGKAGAYKTTVALDIGLCVAAGMPWHGHDIHQQGPVFFICGEGYAGLSRRVKAWAIANNADLVEIPFFASDRPVQFLDSSSVGELIAAIDGMREQYGDPVLVIIDTVNRCFGPGDENSTSDMTKFINAIDGLRHSYGCAVLLAHHTGLSASDRARGSSALRAALDWEYAMNAQNDILKFECTKAKDFAPPKIISFRPKAVSIGDWIGPDDDEAPSACIMEMVELTAALHNTRKSLTGANKVAYNALIGLANQDGKTIPVHVKVWRSAAYSAGISKGNGSARKKAFSRAVTDLQREGWIKADGDFWTPKGTET